MRRKSERSSRLDGLDVCGVMMSLSRVRAELVWIARCLLLPFWLAVSACAPISAEVGSGLPPMPDADVSDTGLAPCDALAPLRLYYWNAHPGDSNNSIDYLIKVENATGAAIPIDSLKVRYYLTNELAPPTAIDVFYADTCCSNKITGFTADVSTSLQAIAAKPGADAYLEIAFTPATGSLANGDAVQVELAFHDPAYARTTTQANDYSYAATAVGTQTEWDKCPGTECNAKFGTCSITVHRDDILVWGIGP